MTSPDTATIDTPGAPVTDVPDEQDEPTALAAAPAPRPATMEDILAVVDELTITSSPTPASGLIRDASITRLRAAFHPSQGGTGSGRSSATRIPLNVEAFTLWGTITELLANLYNATLGDYPKTGSHEQILVNWSRELVGWSRETDLAPDALDRVFHTLEAIRDRIRDHFDPARSGDIAGLHCPRCKESYAYRHDGRTVSLGPALGTTQHPVHGLSIKCRSCEAKWLGEEGIVALTLEYEDPDLTHRLLNGLIALRHEEDAGPDNTIHIRRNASAKSTWCGTVITGPDYAEPASYTLLRDEATCRYCIAASEKYWAVRTPVDLVCDHCGFDGTLTLTAAGRARCPDCRNWIYPNPTPDGAPE